MEKCIKSIIDQTYENIEVLLVDDGSTDKSGTIADQFANNDKRIKVFHKTNAGVSSARNYGIERATGDWIAFIDSDDYVENNYICFLVQNALKYNADISLCISRIINDDGSYTDETVSKTNTVSCCDKNEGLSHLFKADVFGCALNKLYRSDLWTLIRLQEEIKINEDLLANYYCFFYAEKIVYSDAKLYNYRLSFGSASRSGFSEKQFDCVKVNKEITEHARYYLSSDIQDVAASRYAGTLIQIYRAATKSGSKLVEYKVAELLKKDMGLFSHNKVISKKKKVELYILRYFRSFYGLMVRTV